MRWTIRLGTFAGIRVEVHVTFLLLLAGVALFTSSSPRDAFHTVLHMLLLFACVVLHEFGHALMARRFGIATREIVLLPIGGVARLERMPDQPLQEVLVAVAGPAVNVVLAVIFGAILFSANVSAETILQRASGIAARGTVRVVKVRLSETGRKFSSTQRSRFVVLSV